MMRPHVQGPLLALLCLLLSACQSTQTRPDTAATVAPGYRPALDSDEAGLWMVMDKAEKELKTSGKLLHDKAANAYLNEILCRLDAELCGDIRVYLVNVPAFNASMAPNGVMQVWSGLLLRTENEAQLASILGHELAHYQYQHSLKRFRDLKDTAGVLAPFQVVTIAAGVGVVGSLAELAAIGSIMKFSRDNEREADDGGFSLMAGAGYDPSQCAVVWERLIEEMEALEKDDQGVFLASHPAPGERVESLKSMAAQMTAPAAGWDIGADRYNAVVDPLRARFMREELRLRQFPATQVLLDRMKASGRLPAATAFYQAELYRNRAEEDDLAKAEAAYLESMQLDGTPADAYRELGLIYMKSDRSEAARPMFAQYLSAAPEAFDRSMVQAYIERIDEGEN